MSNDTERNILDYWYPLLFSEDLKTDMPYSISLYGEPLVLFRSGDKVTCLQDRCSHRSAPLSIGKTENGTLQCRYHGWTFGKDGVCVRVPSFEPGKDIPDYFRVPHYPAVERDGMVWVWPGDAKNVKEDEEEFRGPKLGEREKNFKMVQQYWDFNYSFEIAMENGLDPSHLQFVHEGFQGENIGPRTVNYPSASGAESVQPIPDGYKGHIYSEQTVRKTDYNILFEKPHYSVAIISKPELLICSWFVPITRNKTRLLFRFYRQFATFLPNFIFQRQNNDVVMQDLVVLVGQQMRVEMGAPRWNIPVQSDSLSVAFRKWWDKVNDEQKVWFSSFDSTLKKPTVQRSLLVDIEDLGREAHPCISYPLKVPEDTIHQIHKVLPGLYPRQYVKKFYQKTSFKLIVAILLLAVVYKLFM